MSDVPWVNKQHWGVQAEEVIEDWELWGHPREVERRKADRRRAAQPLHVRQAQVSSALCCAHCAVMSRPQKRPASTIPSPVHSRLTHYIQTLAGKCNSATSGMSLCKDAVSKVHRHTALRAWSAECQGFCKRLEATAGAGLPGSTA